MKCQMDKRNYNNFSLKLFLEVKEYNLTQVKEKEYLNKIRCGDKIAKDEFVKLNLPLVLFIANQYVNKGMDFDDLTQEGCIGLIEAVEKFDINKNCKFSTYAVWRIRRNILSALKSKNRTIRFPEYFETDLSKIMNAKNECEVLGIKPTLEELSKKTGLSTNVIEKRLNSYKYILSINDSYKDLEIIDTLCSEDCSFIDNYELVDMKKRINKIIDENFTAEEKQILTMRYGLDGNGVRSLASIGRNVKNVSRERMSKIGEDLLFKFRLCKEIEDLKIYLDNPDQSYNNLVNLLNEENLTDASLKNIENLYKYFILFDKRIVNKAITLLDSIEKSILYNCYNEDFTGLNSVDNVYLKKLLYVVLPKMEKYIYLISMRINDDDILKNTCNSVTHPKNSYYSYIDGFEKEFIDVALKSINYKTKSFLDDFFENGLDKPNTRSFSKENYNFFFKKLVYPIRRKVKIVCNEYYLRTSYINIYELFNQYDEDFINLVVDGLSEYDKKLLLKNENIKLDKCKELYIIFDLIGKLNNLLKRKFKSMYITGKKRENIFTIISEYDDNDIINALEDLKLSEYNVIKSICGEKLDKKINELNKQDKDLLFENFIPRIYKILKNNYSLVSSKEKIKKLRLNNK